MVITWTNVDLSSEWYCAICLEVIALWMFTKIITVVLFKVTYLNMKATFPRGQWLKLYFAPLNMMFSWVRSGVYMIYIIMWFVFLDCQLYDMLLWIYHWPSLSYWHYIVNLLHLQLCISLSILLSNRLAVSSASNDKYTLKTFGRIDSRGTFYCRCIT